MTGSRRPPLILTGGPAAGKTTTGRALAQSRPKAAFIYVDDIRQLVVSGAAAAWEGPDGQEQMHLAARNACALASNLHLAGFDVVIADVLDAATVLTYRRHLPDALLVHLVVSLPEALRRAATRTVWLTQEEFSWLHERDQRQPPEVDVRLVVDGLAVEAQVAAVREAWH